MQPSLEMTRPDRRPWLTPSRWWPVLDAATAELDPPFGVLAWDAIAHNAHDLLGRAGGTSLRVASKSIRVREVLSAVLGLPGFAGVLAYSLAEALWLASGGDLYGDVVVGYPTTDRDAIRRLAADERSAARVTLMIDDVAQLDIVDAAVAPSRRPEIRVAIELDASYRTSALGHLGARRSPLHDPLAVRGLAEAVVSRPGFRLVGIMSYEAQIAGVANGRHRLVRELQRQSATELAGRRHDAVTRVREIAELEFVNGGGTGSIESTCTEAAVTEVAVGSGLFGPHLFDHYHHFSPAPAASFALSVVRRPGPGFATLLGGGWIASGAARRDRLPLPVWPEGLRLLRQEGAGETQTPVTGPAADRLKVGDRVWLRHAKAGELSEHLDAFHVVTGSEIIGELATYRGEGKTFL